MAQGGGRRARGSAAGAAQAEKDNGRSESPSVLQSMTDLEFLRGLIEAVDGSGIDSLEINRAGTRIRISKTPTSSGVTVAGYPPVPQMQAAPAVPSPAAPAQAVAAPAGSTGTSQAPEKSEAKPPESKLVDVKSPMVGTFYRAPAPDAPPYVEVGSTVSRGQTLCILEAMKLMNELECEQEGVIREILVDDADPVEFGQVLFRIEPSGSK